MSLSLINNWLDADGKVYINYSLEDIMDTLNCGKTKAVALLKELDSSIVVDDEPADVDNFTSRVQNALETNRGYLL